LSVRLTKPDRDLLTSIVLFIALLVQTEEQDIRKIDFKKYFLLLDLYRDCPEKVKKICALHHGEKGEAMKPRWFVDDAVDI
jgi:hypothetical protein